MVNPAIGFSLYDTYRKHHVDGLSPNFATDHGASRPHYFEVIQKVWVSLLTADYSPDQNTHWQYQDIEDYHVNSTGTGYAKPGKQLQNVSWSLNPTTGKITLDADNPLWPQNDSGFEAVARIVFWYGNNLDGNSGRLIGFSDLISTTNSGNKNGAYKIIINEEGIYSSDR